MNTSISVALFGLLAGCGHHGRDGIDAGGGDAGPINKCKVNDNTGNGVPACMSVAPPDSFDPEIQWAWNGSGDDTNSIVTPLVANLTDDNGDGAIDLCDVPDVVVVASSDPGSPQDPGHIYVLAGDTGAVELMIPYFVDASVTPALGDLDGDGIPEIVTVDTEGELWAFHHDGSVMFGPADVWDGLSSEGSQISWYAASIALADLDGDGHVEIIGGNTVWDDTGHIKWVASQPEASWSATTIADLDGDGKMEVVLGQSAYHDDGTLYWTTALEPGYPQVADLDGDGKPEVLLTNQSGLSLISHDGIVQYSNVRPTDVAAGRTTWIRPAVIGDFNGDGTSEYAMSSADFYTDYKADGTIVWSAPVSDQSGIAAGTAFDFLGDGHTEAMYADETTLWVFDDAGNAIFSMPRSSETLAEYPVVADIDNDGSAEIVVVSNQYLTTSPTVQVIRDKMDRWIQARRIWNEHTYHVTNVREDGTIPAHEVPAWTQLNTFRANAQINDGATCMPVIE